MPVLVRIPTPLRPAAGGNAEVQARGDTVLRLIDDVDRQFPGFKDRVVDGQGALRRFLNIYVNDEDIRFLQGDATPLKDGDHVSIVPAIAGGR